VNNTIIPKATYTDLLRTFGSIVSPVLPSISCSLREIAS
jgi:hypothetical protein